MITFPFSLVLSPSYLLMQTNWPHSFPSLNNLLQYLFLVQLRAPPPLSIFHLLLLDSLRPVSKKPGSLEVACSNGFLAFCFMSCSRARHLLLPAALGCVVTCSLRSFSSDRSNTLNRSSFARDSMMIEEILAPTKDTVRCISCFPLRILFLYFAISCSFSPPIPKMFLFPCLSVNDLVKTQAGWI